MKEMRGNLDKMQQYAVNKFGYQQEYIKGGKFQNQSHNLQNLISASDPISIQQSKYRMDPTSANTRPSFGQNQHGTFSGSGKIGSSYHMQVNIANANEFRQYNQSMQNAPLDGQHYGLVGGGLQNSNSKTMYRTAQ